MGLGQKYPAYGGGGPNCIRTGISLGVIATILIVLRIYVRLRVNHTGTTALIWALAAWALTIVTQTFGILAALHGLGNHLNVVIEAGEGHSFLKSAWLTMFFFLIAIATGKAAVAVFLMEIIGRAYPTIRKTLIAVAALNFLVAVPVAIYSQLQCNPPGALWDPARQQLCHRKINTALSYLAGAVAGFSDLLLALLPIFVLWSLRIDRKLKIGLCCLLGIGVFAAGAATVRTWACSFILSEDSSYHLATLFLWGEIEEWVVIILMSIPPTWPLFKPCLQRFFHSTISNKDSRWVKINGRQYGQSSNGQIYVQHCIDINIEDYPRLPKFT